MCLVECRRSSVANPFSTEHFLLLTIRQNRGRMEWGVVQMSDVLFWREQLHFLQCRAPPCFLQCLPLASFLKESDVGCPGHGAPHCIITALLLLNEVSALIQQREFTRVVPGQKLSVPHPSECSKNKPLQRACLVPFSQLAIVVSF